jgi:hypothetical protein
MQLRRDIGRRVLASEQIQHSGTFRLSTLVRPG